MPANKLNDRKKSGSAGDVKMGVNDVGPIFESVRIIRIIK
jgi:hypothetical protein